MKYIILLSILVNISLQQQCSICVQPSTVIVQGIAQTMVVPNSVRVTFGVTNVTLIPSDGFIEVTKRANKIVDLLKNSSLLNEQDVSTSQIKVEEKNEWVFDEILKREIQKFIGYESSILITIETKEIEKISKIIKDAVELGGANQLQNFEFFTDSESQQQTLNQLRPIAIQDSIKNVKNLVAPYGMKVSNISSINDLWNNHPIPLQENVQFMKFASDSSFPPIIAPEREIRYQVQATFQIEKSQVFDSIYNQ